MFGKHGFIALARSPHAGNLKYIKVDESDLQELPKVKAEFEARFGEAVEYE
jgi:hypothetical protein